MEFFLVGDDGLDPSGEFKGVPVGEKVFPLIGLWITLGVKLEIDPTSDTELVLIFWKSEKKPLKLSIKILIRYFAFVRFAIEERDSKNSNEKKKIENPILVPIRHAGVFRKLPI